MRDFVGFTFRFALDKRRVEHDNFRTKTVNTAADLLTWTDTDKDQPTVNGDDEQNGILEKRRHLGLGQSQTSGV